MRNTKWFDYTFLSIGLLIQVVTFAISTDLIHLTFIDIISLISGCLGICSVCLTAQGRLVAFVFGFAQVITYSFLCWQERFYAELLLNVYYFFTMIYGVYVWRKHIPSSSASGLEVRTRKLPMSVLVLIFVGSAILSSPEMAVIKVPLLYQDYEIQLSFLLKASK